MQIGLATRIMTLAVMGEAERAGIFRSMLAQSVARQKDSKISYNGKVYIVAARAKNRSKARKSRITMGRYLLPPFEHRTRLQNWQNDRLKSPRAYRPLNPDNIADYAR